MSKIRTVYRCAECGAAAAKWAGRCVSCGAWNTLSEERESAVAAAHAARPSLAPAEAATPITTISSEESRPRSTGIPEVDHVLGGGLVAGSVTLLGGEPGIGKSTLLLQLLGAQAAPGRRSLLVSGEESRQQVRLRAERLGTLSPDLWLAAETMLPEVLGHVEQVAPDLLVIDSIQTMLDPVLESAPGRVSQVRECAHALVRVAKARGMATILVGHVTKEGALAGPRVLEHIVDTVLAFEGDRTHALRLLRATKHRFGATGELGLFEMGELGLVGVADASALFLQDRHIGVPGSIVATSIEGQRPLLVEVQALVTESSLANPRRAAQGLDQGRMQMLLAVLTRRLHVHFGAADVFASAAGGVRLTEPAADLAVCLALLSAVTDKALPGDLVAIGEVGLAGEIRQVGHLERRLTEAARLGFRRAIVPRNTPDTGARAGIEVVRAGTLSDAVDHLHLGSRLARLAAREKSGSDPESGSIIGAASGGRPGPAMAPRALAASSSRGAR